MEICVGKPIQGDLTLEHFRPGSATTLFYDRAHRPQTAVVDMHLHSRPFGGAAVPFPELVSWLQRAGTLFAVLYGIGQRLPPTGNCSYYLDCPGTEVAASTTNDYINAQNVVEAKEQLSGPAGPVVLVAMTFMNLSNPVGIVQEMEEMQAEYPGVFRWAGEVNVVKQALFENNAGLPIDKDVIPEWKDFMKVLADAGTPLTLHCDLGSDEEPLKYLPLMMEVLEHYPENKIVWAHMGGLSKELTPLRPMLLEEPLYADSHAQLLRQLFDKFPNLMIDLAWDVLYHAVYADPAKKQEYVDLLNEYPKRFLTGVDFVAHENKQEHEYHEQLNLTSDILRTLRDDTFRAIALGQNFFDLVGLDYEAPNACYSTMRFGAVAPDTKLLMQLTSVLGVVVIALVAMLLFHMVVEACRGNDLAPGDAVDADIQGIRGSSVVQTSFNIVKNIVGEGMLSLPAALSAGTGLLPGIGVALCLGAVSGYTFSVLGRVCHATGGNTHKECCLELDARIQAQVMSIANVLKAGMGCWTYAIVIADSCSRVAHFYGLTGIFAGREAVLVVIAVAVLAPLCLQKDLSVLSYTSFIGICGEIFIIVFMQWRYVDGSYSAGGKYHQLVQQEDRPEFPIGVDFFRVSAGSFVLFGALSTAFMAHYNAPKYYSQLRGHCPQRFDAAVGLAFVLCLGIYLWIMTVGYLTFGENSQGLILNNYAEADPFAAVARLSISVAVIFGFPLVFTAFRDSALSVAGLQINENRNFYGSTVALLCFTVLGACFVDDIGLLNSVGGSILGSLIMFFFPGLLCYTCCRFQANKLGAVQEFSSSEYYLSILVMIFGLFVMSVGGTIVILKNMAPGLLTPTA